MTHVVDVNAYEISGTRVCLEMRAPDSSYVFMNSDKPDISYATADLDSMQGLRDYLEKAGAFDSTVMSNGQCDSLLIDDEGNPVLVHQEEVVVPGNHAGPVYTKRSKLNNSAEVFNLAKVIMKAYDEPLTLEDRNKTRYEGLLRRINENEGSSISADRVDRLAKAIVEVEVRPNRALLQAVIDRVKGIQD
jgi:hypothetical protein